MGQVTVKINGYAYTVICEDGQEQHLQAMARQVEERIERVRNGVGHNGEGRMLALASLLMADELYDLSADKVPIATAEKIMEAERILKKNTLNTEKLLLLVEQAEAIADLLEID
ncbi:cell division protein ZapA [Entomobacter blattae]|uniref:Cell division protein ZapA n=1 Tax=Entomobacter blattae TaxID=2762277 RepID=A0A7H1NTB0_9PROT|nr:cell division protein ZapA [Entomobacter blattae]QNT79020.1 Cell division protein ZapA [Entomobacter blattae]